MGVSLGVRGAHGTVDAIRKEFDSEILSAKSQIEKELVGNSDADNEALKRNEADSSRTCRRLFFEEIDPWDTEEEMEEIDIQTPEIQLGEGDEELALLNLSDPCDESHPLVTPIPESKLEESPHEKLHPGLMLCQDNISIQQVARH